MTRHLASAAPATSAVTMANIRTWLVTLVIVLFASALLSTPTKILHVLAPLTLVLTPLLLLLDVLHRPYNTIEVFKVWNFSRPELFDAR